AIQNNDDALLTPIAVSNLIPTSPTGGHQQLVYPGTLDVSALTGNLAIGGTGTGTSLLLMPSASGQLQLLAGGNIGAASIAMLDSDVGELPGLFSIYNGQNFENGGQLAFPTVLPDTSESVLALQHT